MQLSNKLSPIILWHAHKSPTHDYKFHLQSRKMNSQENKKAQGIRIFIPYQRRLQLVYSPSRLLVEIITCSNSTHTCRFLTSMTLCAIIEIRVRAISIKDPHMLSMVDPSKCQRGISYKHTRIYFLSSQYVDIDGVCT